jgi:hypothetical protein
MGLDNDARLSAIEDAGGRKLSEFNAGMKVVAQTGCLACHRIGE